jgi:5-methyltetrahydrofolate--homocysteine methyltransferase
VLERLGLEPNKYILLSAHREENIDTEKNFTSLFTAINALAEKYDMPILYSCHPRSKKRLETSGFKLDPRVRVNEPLGFNDYNKLQMNALAIVSDSGTLPEESSFYLSIGHPIAAVCIRTSTERPEALEAALRVYQGKAAVNSVNGKEESLRTVLPLVKKYGAAVVGLTLDENGIPDTAEKRVAIARRILERAVAAGIPKEDVWIDCLTLTVSAQQEQAMETLKAVRAVREELGLNTVLGVSNISFGLPNRLLVTQAFLTCALEAGLTLPIINPNQKEIMDVIAARRVLCGEDEGCRAYVERFAEEVQAEKKPAAAASGMTLGEAIRKGLRNESGKLTRDALHTRSEMELVEKELIPALEETGEKYEQGKVFLPQLLSAAQAAQAAFEEIRGSLLKKGEQSADRGTVIMATVQGDIHDIGKNIVITVLENYGYRVRDLGKDVPPETIVKETVEKKIRMVGLSALMTTTLPAMAETVRRLKELPDPPQVMVGGAVVTADYAKSIGADFYARDVRDAVKITGQVFGSNGQ